MPCCGDKYADEVFASSTTFTFDQNGGGGGGEFDDWLPEDDDWIQDVKGWLEGLFGSPGQACAEITHSWLERYWCTWYQGGMEPCPGTPDPRRAALAAQRDPESARRQRDRMAGNPLADGLAPSVQDMQDPRLAYLWLNAAWGGWDCIARTDPTLPDDTLAWILAATPDWGEPDGPGPGDFPPPGGTVDGGGGGMTGGPGQGLALLVGGGLLIALLREAL